MSESNELFGRRIKVRVKTKPGMFSFERAVSFPTLDGRCSMLLDASAIVDGEIECTIINTDSYRAFVRLPGESIKHGRSAYLRWGQFRLTERNYDDSRGSN